MAEKSNPAEKRLFQLFHEHTDVQNRVGRKNQILKIEFGTMWKSSALGP